MILTKDSESDFKLKRVLGGDCWTPTGSPEPGVRVTFKLTARWVRQPQAECNCKTPSPSQTRPGRFKFVTYSILVIFKLSQCSKQVITACLLLLQVRLTSKFSGLRRNMMKYCQWSR